MLKVANEHGLILLSCGTYGNVIRFLVPLTASDELVREGMDIFEAALTEAVIAKARVIFGSAISPGSRSPGST